MGSRGAPTAVPACHMQILMTLACHSSQSNIPVCNQFSVLASAVFLVQSYTLTFLYGLLFSIQACESLNYVPIHPTQTYGELRHYCEDLKAIDLSFPGEQSSNKQDYGSSKPLLFNCRPYNCLSHQNSMHNVNSWK